MRGRGHRRTSRVNGRVGLVKFSRPDETGFDVEGKNISFGIRTGSLYPQADVVDLDLAEIAGQFGVVLYDAQSDKAVVATDHFGMHSMYTARRDGKIYVSTSALVLAKHLRIRPSLPGLYAFLRSGYQFGTMTNWDGVERIEPGTRLMVTGGKARFERYWTAEVDPQVVQLGLRGTVDHCIEVATDDIRIYLGESSEMWSDLTGGFDSRLLNLLLQHADITFTTNTVGREDDADVRIGDRVARTGRWPWKRFGAPSDCEPETAARFLRMALAWGDGHLDCVQLARVLRVHADQSRSCKILANGGGGENFSNFAWTQEFLGAGRSNRVNYENLLSMRLLSPLDTSIFRDDPTPRVRSDFRARMQAWSEPFSDEPNTVQLSRLHAFKSTGHFGAYHSAAAAFLDQELPFYFPRTFTAALSASFRHRNSHRLQRHMIDRLNPRVGAVPTDYGGPAAPWRLANAHRFLPYHRRIAQAAVRKARQRIAPHRPRAAGSADPVAAAGREIVLRALFGEGTPELSDWHSAPLYDVAALETFLGRAPDADFSEPDLFGRVITVELALREAGVPVDD